MDLDAKKTILKEKLNAQKNPFGVREEPEEWVETPEEEDYTIRKYQKFQEEIAGTDEGLTPNYFVPENSEECLVDDDTPSIFDDVASNVFTLRDGVSFGVTDKEEKKHKKKIKKEKKATKEEKKKRNAYIERCTSEMNISERKPNDGQLIAEIISNSKIIKVVEDKIFLYNKKEGGLFKMSNKQEVQTEMLSWLRKNTPYSSKITTRDLNEAYRLLFLNAKLQTPPLEKAYNKPYVLCNNGVLDLESMKLVKPSPDFEFICKVNACFNKEAQGEVFKSFLDFATGQDKSMKKLIQEIMGYALSNYTNIRKAFLFIGVRHTGKSTILNIIRDLAGENNCAAVNIQDIEDEYYVADLLGNRLDIAPDLPAKPIKGEISKFKSLTSELDVVSGRNPFEPVSCGRGRIKFLFGSNHHLTFRGIGKDDLDAFFDRMIYVPFNNVVDEDRYDGDFKEKLALEYDFIYTWSMEGLRRLIKNGYRFTECQASLRCKDDAIAQYCPEEIFFNRCITLKSNGRYESSEEIKKAFSNFLLDNNIKGNFNIINYLSNQNIKKVRKRIDEDGYISSEGNPIYVYEGIRLRAKYRVS